MVMVFYLSRLYRKLEPLLSTLKFLRDCNVSFVSVNENMDFTTRWGKLILNILGTLAEIYVDELSETTSQGKLQRARNGLYNGSIPLGYCNGLCGNCTDLNGPGYCPHVGEKDRSDGKILIPHPIDAVGLRRMFKLSGNDGYSDRRIAGYLNQTPVRYGGINYIVRPKR